MPYYHLIVFNYAKQILIRPNRPNSVSKLSACISTQDHEMMSVLTPIDVSPNGCLLTSVTQPSNLTADIRSDDRLSAAVRSDARLQTSIIMRQNRRPKAINHPVTPMLAAFHVHVRGTCPRGGITLYRRLHEKHTRI